MPELPEVETVRAGVDSWVTGRIIDQVDIQHPRAVRRHIGGATDLADRLRGELVTGTGRRGKYMWLVLESGDALVVHLGMSGQLLIQPRSAQRETHLRVNISFTDVGSELRFVDQRTFGGVFLDSLTGVAPDAVAHIALDPFDPKFDVQSTARVMKTKRTEVKRVLLDQTVVSGIGNIYADEALWRSKINWATNADVISVARLVGLLEDAHAVMAQALSAGGTSFDALYVNVNGASGYFDRQLAVYGKGAQPCPRCGTAIVREQFMNRSSFRCPRCQRGKPRREAI